MTRNTRIGGAGTVRVLPDVTGLDKQFDYTLPEQLRRRGSGRLDRSSAAARSAVRGWVTAVDPALEVDPSRLHPISPSRRSGPHPELIDLAEWASVRWAAGRLRPFLVAASPPANVTTFPAPAHGQVEMPPELSRSVRAR